MTASTTRTFGRVVIHRQGRDRHRPAFTTPDGTMYVSPATDLAWRHATDTERATFQTRVAEHQHTVGGIEDDSLYETARWTTSTGAPHGGVPQSSPAHRYERGHDPELTGRAGRNLLRRAHPG